MDFSNTVSLGKWLRRALAIIIVLIIVAAVGVYASKNDINYITINFPDDTQISVVTSKTAIKDILEENNIVLLSDEQVEPSLDSVINASKEITISKISEKPVIVAEEKSEVSTEQILGNYITVREAIVTEQVEIPFETVTKDVSQSGTETQDKVIQEGENGLKEVKYKVRYENEVEVSKTPIEETIVKEPVDKIIQVSTKIVSRSNSYRVSSAISLGDTVAGATPTVTTMNVSAYTSAPPYYSATASGASASSWYTLAAGPSVPFGTVIYIPYFASSPNGGWFVVEDRGGAITNSKLDVYMDTEAECVSFGRRNLECYVYY